MKKNYFMAIMAAALLSACSNDLKDVHGTPELAQNTELQNAVQFDAYMNRASTRAGVAGDLVNTTLATEGFGVFGYYTDDDFYSPIYAPNFMYNTQVKKNGGNWEYSPVMYWPNEFGGDASSVGADRVSFFAYAPWVEVTPTSDAVAAGEDETGIIGLSRNGAVGDPFVKYAVSLKPAEAVDLAWGVAKEDFTSSASASVTNNVAAGAPYLNLVKPAVGAKINFDFKHALAKLNVQIDAAVDAVAPGNELDKNTRIFVRSITFNGFAMKGALNLNSSTANWYDLSGNGYLEGSPVTIYDGRSDGNEAVSADVNEFPIGLNPNIIQREAYTVSGGAITAPAATAGVTARAQNLFTSDVANSPVYVIPTGQNMSITIVYDVETYSPKLPGYLADGTTPGSSIQNSISQTITDFKLEAGKSHTLKLHLGMASVQFEATVADWEDESEVEGNLPVYPHYTISQLKSKLNEVLAGTSDVSYDVLKTIFIGMYVHPDGTINSTITGATGTIACLAETDEDVDSGIPGSRILVMGLADAYQTEEDDGISQEFHFVNNHQTELAKWTKFSNNRYWWSGKSNQELGFDAYDMFEVPGSYHEEFKTIGTARGNRSGKRNGYAITAAAMSHQYASDFYAYDAAWNYRTSADDATGSEYGLEGETGAAGHWFLPTVEQVILMGAPAYRLYSPDYTNNISNVTGPLRDLSGSYWLASEYIANNVWRYVATYGYYANDQKFPNSLDASENHALYHYKVRPVYAY